MATTSTDNADRYKSQINPLNASCSAFLRPPGGPWHTAFYGAKHLTKKASPAAALLAERLLLRIFTCSRPALGHRI